MDRLPPHLRDRSTTVTKKKGYESLFPGSEYDDDEKEFITAMMKYMDETHNRFPTFVQVLNVAKSLGYRKVKDG